VEISWDEERYPKVPKPTTVDSRFGVETKFAAVDK
jgi:hypothetical protein